MLTKGINKKIPTHLYVNQRTQQENTDTFICQLTDKTRKYRHIYMSTKGNNKKIH